MNLNTIKTLEQLAELLKPYFAGKRNIEGLNVGAVGSPPVANDITAADDITANGTLTSGADLKVGTYARIGTPSSPLTGAGDLTTQDDLRVEGDATIVGTLTGGTHSHAEDNTLSQLTVGSPTPTAGAGDIVAQDQGYFGGGLQVQGSTYYTSGVGAELTWNSTYARLLSYNRGASSYQPLYLDGSQILLREANSTVATVDSADLFTTQLTDYFSSSTKLGWASYTHNKIYYRTLGKFVYIQFYIEGTSNSTACSFTVPYTSKNATDYYVQGACRAQNNTVWGNYPGWYSLAPNSTLVTCYTTQSTSTAWGSTGTKAVVGHFTYERA